MRLHDLLRFTNRRAQNDSRCAGLAVSGTGELDRYHKGAYKSLREEASKASLGRALQDKHYLRKHGKEAYYGQAKEAT